MADMGDMEKRIDIIINAIGKSDMSGLEKGLKSSTAAIEKAQTKLNQFQGAAPKTPEVKAPSDRAKFEAMLRGPIPPSDTYSGGLIKRSPAIDKQITQANKLALAYENALQIKKNIAVYDQATAAQEKGIAGREKEAATFQMNDLKRKKAEQSLAVKNLGLQRSLLRGASRFRFEYLGVMFAGMAIQKAFGGIVKNATQANAKIERTNREMGKMLDSSVIFKAYIDLTAGAMKLLGSEGMGFAYVLGQGLALFGQMVLFMSSLNSLALQRVQTEVMVLQAKTAGLDIDKFSNIIQQSSLKNLILGKNIRAEILRMLGVQVATEKAITAENAKQAALAATTGATKKGVMSNRTGAVMVGGGGSKATGLAGMAGMAMTLVGLSGAAGDASDSLTQLGSALTMVSVAMMVFQGASGAMAGILGGIGAVAGAITGAFTAAAGAVSAFLAAIGPIGWVILAIGAVIAVAQAVGGVFKDLVNGALNWGFDLIKNFVNGILGGLSWLVDQIKGVLDWIKKAIGFDSPANDRMAAGWGTDMMSYFGKGADKGATRAMDKTKKTTYNSVKMMSTWFRWLGLQAGDFWKSLGLGMGGLLPNVGGLPGGGAGIPAMFAPTVDPAAVDQMMSDFGDAAATLFSNLPWDVFFSGVGGAFGAALEAFDFTGAFSDFATGYANALQQIQWKDYLVPMADAAGQVMSDKNWTGVFGQSDMGKAIATLFNETDWATVFNTVAESLSAALGTPAFTELITKLIEAVGSAMDSVDWTTHFTKAGDFFGTAIKNMPWAEIFDLTAIALKDALERVTLSDWATALALIGQAVGEVIENIPIATWVTTFSNMIAALGIIVSNFAKGLMDALNPLSGHNMTVNPNTGEINWGAKGGIVPNTGPAFLHKNEMVLPSSIARPLMNAIGGGINLTSQRSTEGAGGGPITINLGGINVASSYDVNSMMDEIENRLRNRAIYY